MGKDLKSENLTISVPNVGCDKNCPYCVSRMTGYMETNRNLMSRNIDRVFNIARQAEITSVLITGKGEPTLDCKYLLYLFDLIKEFNFPIELQTNGIKLVQNPYLIDQLYLYGLNVLAISIDSSDQFINSQPILSRASSVGIVTRITVNVTNILGDIVFLNILEHCKNNKVNQLTLRRIIAPDDPKDLKAAQWIEKNAPEGRYNLLVDQAYNVIRDRGKLLRQLNNGTNIYDLDGVAFSHSDYCIQEANNGDNIRSLVFQEDGHLYTSWNSRASILF